MLLVDMLPAYVQAADKLSTDMPAISKQEILINKNELLSGS